MPTPTTPNKGLAQQAQGTNPWDYTLNVDDFGRIDMAMCGTETVNLQDNHLATITLTNTYPLNNPPITNASYIPKRIVFTGNLSQATTIKIPSPVQGWWILQNSTDNAYPLYFGGSLSTVQLMPGVLLPVYCDSSNAVILGGAYKAQQLAQAGDLKASASPYDQAGWLICDGRWLPIASYTALYNAIQTYWGGSGDNFAIPDFRGKSLVAADNQGTRGAAGNLPGWGFTANGGVASVSLTGAQNGIHSHGDSTGHIHTSTQAGHQHAVTPSVAGSGSSGLGYGGAPIGLIDAATDWRAPDITVARSYVGVDNSGSGSPHTNIQPSQAVHWMIYTGL